jgi:glycosyltransferase involved in cell wall biosynthesis
MNEDKKQSGIPRVSVLMTVYNAAPFLKESIGSILAQTFSDWELVIVNDGSTDESASILSAYQDHRIRVFSFEKNIGRTPALRYGFDRARAEYIAVMDADDIAYPSRLARQADFLDQHSTVVMVAGWQELMGMDGQRKGGFEPPSTKQELYDCLGETNVLGHSTLMYRKKAVSAVGGYPSRYVVAQDFALILLLAQYGEIAVIGEYFLKVRLFPGSMMRSGKYNLIMAQEDLELKRQAGKILPLSARGRKLNRMAIAKCELRCGRLLLTRGRFLSAIKMIVAGFFHLILLKISVRDE